MRLLYRPDESVAADFIPFYWQGQYHLFYLRDWRDIEGHGEGTPWWHLVTSDFVAFEDWGQALERGGAGEQDRWVFTGSVVTHDDAFQIYYTGHNSHLKGTGRPVQAVMRATSSDLRIWRKDEGFRMIAPADQGYEPDDWRDPFVCWNEQAGEYWLLLAARGQEGPSRNRGFVALATSPDTASWRGQEPLGAPDRYYTHECPDLFSIGDWWYLVYSTFSEGTVTHYRMSRDPRGPWIAPPDDAFDTRAYYAAKTAGDGQLRYLFGWLATREGETDDGRWQWGGDLVVHEIRQRDDGTLGVSLPRSVGDGLSNLRPLAPRAVLGQWRVDGDKAMTDAAQRYSATHLGAMPSCCLLEAKVHLGQGATAAGMLLRADERLDSYYQIRIEPHRQRVVIDRWPRPGDEAFMLERPLGLAPGEDIDLRVLVDGSCLVVYVNRDIALSCRMYDHSDGGWGLFAQDGGVSFSGLNCRTDSTGVHRWR